MDTMIDVGLELLVEDQPMYIMVVVTASDVSVKTHVHRETYNTSGKPPKCFFFSNEKRKRIKKQL